MPPNAVSHRFTLRIISFALLMIVTLLVIRTQVASAKSVMPQSSRLKPTIVLVHGAWADSSSWDQVVQRLQHDGYTVDVPPNPLRGIPSDSAYLASFLSTISGPIILVGHSYGGVVITNAAYGNSNVKALVYIDAFILDQGQSVQQFVSGSCIAGNPTQTFKFVPYPGTSDVDLYVDTQPNASFIGFNQCFANGLPTREASVLAATQRPLLLSAFSEKSGPPAWKTIPAWALIGTEDRAITPTEQLAMAEQAKAHVVEVAAPHLSMVYRPDAVTGIIVEAAQATAH